MMPAISVIGVIGNTYTIVVLALIIRYEKQIGHMFKYLLAKAVHDQIHFIVQSFAPLYYCTYCSTFQTYASQVWYIYFFFYVECINELSSAFFELMATFDCLITLKKKLAFCHKPWFFWAATAGITTRRRA
jgi:hypothetical protein